jgi:hypothetical protein
MITQGTSPIDPKVLSTLFNFTHLVFRRNVADITHDESLRSPQPGGNCMNWVAGHIVTTRDSILELVGRAPRWTEAERSRYARGSGGIKNPSDAVPWERILAEMDAGQEALLAGIAALTPEQLAAPLPADKNPFRVDSFGEQLAALHFHETYHVGQLGILRRLAGKPGAIK